MDNPLDNKKIQQYIHVALRAWHATSHTPENLLTFLLLVRERQAQLTDEGSPTLLRLATNQVLLDGLEELETQDETAARVLRLRFPDNNSLLMAANKLNVSQHTVSRLQRAAIDRLTNIIWGREMSLRETQAQHIEAQLPPPSYSRLFGLDNDKTKLATQLTQAEAPWVVSIVGMGGIGKTALADSVTRQIIRQFYFDKIIWLRVEPSTIDSRAITPHLTFENLVINLAQHLWPDDAATLSPQQRLTQVRQAIKAKPHLIAIDNLESEADTAYLLARLNDLAQPSKFLITSRTHPPKQAAIFNFPIDELSLESTGALIRHHAQDIGASDVAAATDEEIQAIHEVVGGNPLAIKLVVSLLDILPLSQVLSGLAYGRAAPIEELYRHIYWQTWQILSPSARLLLQAMPLVSETGASPEYLKTISGLEEPLLWPALQELRNRSLLEVRGTIQEKRYGIHRLTETFLHTEIIHWPEENKGS